MLNKLELKVPPVAVGLLVAAIMFGVNRYVAISLLPGHWRKSAALTLLVLGFAVGISGVIAFRRARTTVDPTRPGKASSLVSTGIYRYTRNPMYVGMLLGLVGWVFWLNGGAAFIGLPLFVGYMNRFQIVPEERFLGELFGTDYQTYCTRVRRWL